MINDAKDYKEISRVATALNAIGVIHNEHHSNTLKEKLSSIVRSIEAEKLNRVTPLISRVKDSWSYFDADVRQKFESYVENLPKDKFEDIDIFLSIDGLQKSAEKRLRIATRTELDEPLFFIAPEQVSNRIIELYAQSKNFEQANNFASTVTRYAGDYNRDQIQRIIKACGENEQIEYSFEIGTVINAIRKNNNVSDDEVDEWLLESKLNKFVKLKEESD